MRLLTRAALARTAALIVAIAIPLTVLAVDTSGVFTKKNVGTYLTGKTTEKWASHGKTPTVQRVGAAQAAITDSTTGDGTAATAAAGVGVVTLAFPIQLAAMTTAAADLLSAYTPGYKFKILSVAFSTTTIGAGTSASQVLNLEIGTTNVTGGAVTVTLAGTDTLGELTAGTTVTAANTGTAADSISIEVAASGTVFTSGAGVLLVKIQNMDTADAVAALTARSNEWRASLVEKGLIKGAP